MPHIEKTLGVVRAVVEEQLAPAKVIDVIVDEDLDSTGKSILRIEVVFEVEEGKLDPAKVVGLARHLREPLEALKEDRFPVFTFVKPEELDGAAA